MAVFRDIRDINFEQTVVTVGSFDGVHSGHRMLLRRVADLSALYRFRSVALTFSPHPRQALETAGETCLLLNTPDEKIALLEETGIDDIVVYPFDKALSQTSASDFVRDILIGKLHARYLVVGQDHHFGKERNGNVQFLQDFTTQSDLQVEVVDLKKLNRKISSSAIRHALWGGDLESANEMLGYPYIISGRVIAGNRLGRTIGFPTANIEAPGYKLLPKEGVYRVKVRVCGEVQNSGFQIQNPKNDAFEHLGMLYIGKRPVLKEEGEKVHVEVHIFGFDRQIYGQEIAVALTHRIRDDIRFENLEQLAGQLHQDRQKITDIL